MGCFYLTRQREEKTQPRLVTVCSPLLDLTQTPTARLGDIILTFTVSVTAVWIALGRNHSSLDAALRCGHAQHSGVICLYLLPLSQEEWLYLCLEICCPDVTSFPAQLLPFKTSGPQGMWFKRLSCPFSHQDVLFVRDISGHVLRSMSLDPVFKWRENMSCAERWACKGMFLPELIRHCLFKCRWVNHCDMFHKCSFPSNQSVAVSSPYHDPFLWLIKAAQRRLQDFNFLSICPNLTALLPLSIYNGSSHSKECKGKEVITLFCQHFWLIKD